MLFIKKDDKPEKIRQKDTKFKGWKWITIYKGDKIDLPEDHGLRLGLVPVEKKGSSIPNIKMREEVKYMEDVDSKKKEAELYKADLESIKGIGEKVAKDIMMIYSTKESLLKDLSNGNDIPVRDDLAKLIKKSKRFKVM